MKWFGMLLSGVALVVTAKAAQMTEENAKFLDGYEKVHQALVADDLTGAKKAADELRSQGSELANAKSLSEARSAFEKLSAEAEKIAAGQPGYFVLRCPMLKKDWVQTSAKVANPYGGKEMIECGEVKK